MQTVKMFIPDPTAKQFGTLMLDTGPVAISPAGADVPVDSIEIAIRAGLSFKVTVGGTDYFVPPVRSGA